MVGGKKYARLLFLLGVTLCAAVLGALCVGRYSFDPRDALGAVASKLRGDAGDATMQTIVFVIRFPRIAAALLVGMALSMSGAVYQSVFRNPLVSPDLLGVSSGASVGAAIAIVCGAGFASLQLFAFLGGMAAVLLSTMLPKLLRNASNMMLVLSGIIVGGLMSSVLGVIKFMAEDQVELSSIVFWQMGSLASVNRMQLASVAPTLIICAAVLIAMSWRLNILSFGEQEARTVGVHVPRLRAVMIVCASLMTASAVSVSGTVGWIGLVIPHFGRMVAGSDNTKLLPVTALIGAMFLLLIDTAARALTTMEIPLSILSGLFGAPFFAWLLYRQRAKIL